jgi:predicted RNA binding protein with dsRBD fold (UPF0201 family)
VIKSIVPSKVELRIKAHVNPSESSEKVFQAIKNVLEKCSLELKYGSIIIGKSIESDSINIIHDQVRSKAAMGVLRRVLSQNRIGDTSWFLLNKQAASAHSVVVIENEQESPLGPIKVMIECNELDAVIDWLAPAPVV